MSNKNHETMDGTLDNPQVEKSAANTGKPARPPKPKPSLGRETKVGLGVIGALLVIFVVVLVVRLRGGGEDDVAQNGTSAAEDGVADGVEKKASPLKDATVIPAQTGRPSSGQFWDGKAGAKADNAGADSAYGGGPYSNRDQSAVQEFGRREYSPPNGANAATNGEPAGEFPAGSGADGAVKNPFDAGQATSSASKGAPATKNSLRPAGGAQATGSQYEPMNGLMETDRDIEQTIGDEVTHNDNDRGSSGANSASGNPFQARQASGTPLSGDAAFQDYSPPRETAADENGATALEGRRTEPSGNTDPRGGAESGLRIVAGEGANIARDRDLESNSGSGPLTPVDDYPPQAGSKLRASSKTASRSEAPAADDPLFRKPRPRLAEPAPADEAFTAAESKAPARLKDANSTPADELYIVQPNDNYWTIAKERYGSGAYFKALYEHNRRHAGQADTIGPGARLRLPDEATLQRLYPTLCPPPQRLAAAPQARRASVNVEVDEGDYEVQDGDTLYEVARRQLGKGSRFAEVYELNQDVIGKPTDRLQPGTRLRLPGER
jgi:nucleoid-associated protein YgaU